MSTNKRMPGREAVLAASELAAFAGLTPKEATVLSYMLEGFTYGDTAAHLGVKECTVKTHAGVLLHKLQCTRAELWPLVLRLRNRNR